MTQQAKRRSEGLENVYVYFLSFILDPSLYINRLQSSSWISCWRPPTFPIAFHRKHSLTFLLRHDAFASVVVKIRWAPRPNLYLSLETRLQHDLVVAVGFYGLWYGLWSSAGEGVDAVWLHRVCNRSSSWLSRFTRRYQRWLHSYWQTDGGTHSHYSAMWCFKDSSSVNGNDSRWRRPRV